MKEWKELLKLKDADQVFDLVCAFNYFAGNFQNNIPIEEILQGHKKITEEFKKTNGLEDIKNCLNTKYADEPFVRVIEGEPNIKDVVGTNFCVMTARKARTENKVILVSVIDNLCKGASGQAVQNMNLICGFDETEGLQLAPLFP